MGTWDGRPGKGKRNSRQGAAGSEVLLYSYISKLAGKPTDKCVMPVPSFNAITDGMYINNSLACDEFLMVTTSAGGFAEATINDTEVYQTLKFGHQEDVRRNVSNVGDARCFARSVGHHHGVS